MGKFKKKHLTEVFLVVCAFSFFYAGIAALFAPATSAWLNVKDQTAAVSFNDSTALPLGSTTSPIIHVKIPDAVKAAYMSSCVAATPSIRDRVIGMVNSTEINSLVVDIKDYSGMISYTPDDISLRQEATSTRSCRVSDIRGLIERLHKDNIYVIGRIAVFQDQYFAEKYPELAIRSTSTGQKWKDDKGMEWIDPSSRKMWEYAATIARDAYSIGFDEINFDYIRFPSDGKISDMRFPVSGNRPKTEVIKEFYQYINSQMRTAGITTSADIFGMTTTSTDDLNIGQVLENTLPYFDYVAPMVYPSHYPKGFNNWANPNAHPYELIKFVMDAGAKRATAASTTPLKLRPWLQDFSLGAPKYGKAEVEAQIQATYDAGLTSWMLWDPGCKYAGGALLPE